MAKPRRYTAEDCRRVADLYASVGPTQAASTLGMTIDMVWWIVRRRCPHFGIQVVSRYDMTATPEERRARRAERIRERRAAERAAREVKPRVRVPQTERVRTKRAVHRAKVAAYQPPRFIDEHLAIELLRRALPRRGAAA